VKITYTIATFSLFFSFTTYSYTPVLTSKVVCLTFGEKLDAAKFESHKIDPLRQEETCYVLVDYVKLPPEKAQAARDAAKIIYERLGAEQK
jgi:hypothetical protein